MKRSKSARSKKLNSPHQKLNVTIWENYDPEQGEYQKRHVTVRTGSTIADVAAALVRAMRVPKSQLAHVKFAPHFDGRIRATLHSEVGRKIREAMTDPIRSIGGPGLVNYSEPI